MISTVPAIAQSGALKAYQDVDSGKSGGTGGDDFAGLVGRALQGAIVTGQQADTQAAQAIAGHGDLTQVVTAVSRAELTLQTTVAIRDRVIQAYQDIIKMPI
jgi:flagellar hook-basal body complex protein FliE